MSASGSSLASVTTTAGIQFSLEEKKSEAPLRFASFINRDGNKLDLSGQGLESKDIPDVIAVLKKYPHVKEVNFFGNRLGAEGAREFARLNRYATSVDFSYNGLGDQGAKEFAELNQVVTTVSLAANGIEAQGAADFADKNRVATTVEFAGNKLGAQGANDFAERNKVATTVGLGNNGIGPQGAKAFAIWNSRNKVATTVDLCNNEIGAQGAEDFAKENKFATTVVLSHNGIGSQGAKRFAENNTVATTVDLSSNEIGDQGAKDFAENNKVAATVDLSGNYISLLAASALEACRTLKSLNIAFSNIPLEIGNEIQTRIARNWVIYNQLGPEESKPETPLRFSYFIKDDRLELSDMKLRSEDVADVIAVLNRFPNIKVVDLSHNNLGAWGVKAFALLNQTATTVNFRYNGIGAQGAKVFAENNKIVTTVDLGCNGIGDQGAKDFAQNNKVATTVNLRVNGIGDQGAMDFAVNNKVATTVSLSYNEIHDQGAKDFLENNTVAVEVDLSWNEITQLDANVLEKGRILKSLNLSHTYIRKEIQDEIAARISRNWADYSKNEMKSPAAGAAYFDMPAARRDLPLAETKKAPSKAAAVLQHIASYRPSSRSG